MSVEIAFSAVLVMLLYAVPGFVMVKTKLISDNSISVFAKLLMYVCSPCLVFYSMTRVTYSKELFLQMIFAFFFLLIIKGMVMMAVFLLLKNKVSNPKYRIYTIATCMGNYAFMGVPLLEALLPQYPQAVAFSAAASISLNVIGWTVASSIITLDVKYIKVKKILFNPAVIALLLSLPFFLTKTHPVGKLNEFVTTMGRMTTPLCMLIMGMRLAKSSLKSMFLRFGQYVVVAVKQMLLPLLGILILNLFPIDYNMKLSIYIMLACPIASVVLNFSEMLGEGQEYAANAVLLGTMLSAVTIPVMVSLV